MTRAERVEILTKRIMRSRREIGESVMRLGLENNVPGILQNLGHLYRDQVELRMLLEDDTNMRNRVEELLDAGSRRERE